MTTPPTTAGWYPDPEGSGGQRYWDGAEWTAQPPAAAGTPDDSEETAAWPVELPPWPEDMEMPSWEDAGKAEPVVPVEDAVVEESVDEDTVVERLDEDTVVEESGQSPEPREASEPEIAETPIADAEPDASSEQTTTVVQLVDEPTAVVKLPEQPTAVVPTFTPPPPPAPFATAAPPAEPESSASPLKGYLAGVAALLVVLAGVLVWAFAFADPGTGSTEANGTPGTSETAGTTDPTTDSADPTESSDGGSTGAGGQAVDGDVTITSNGVEITPTVSAADNDLLTKSAAGQFVVVRLTLLNNGELPATFLADQQVLTAGGQIYNTETESTFYLGGISAVLYPGEPVEVAFAYDVPPGTVPESLQVHGDLASAGAVIELT
jgi:Domain of unknown function (DUF4352)/Protein of unknown function (DUF2510)